MRRAFSGYIAACIAALIILIPDSRENLTPNVIRAQLDRKMRTAGIADFNDNHDASLVRRAGIRAAIGNAQGDDRLDLRRATLDADIENYATIDLVVLMGRENISDVGTTTFVEVNVRTSE